MGGMIETSVATVEAVTGRRTGLTEVDVDLGEKTERAINYDLLTGEIFPGDQVLLNTTAVSLSLGTGGWHFVIANLSRPERELAPGGHIIKLRYTPQQLKVLSVEEEASGYTQIFNGFRSLEGLPVLILPLHSALAPAAVSCKMTCPKSRLIYLMTDQAALPLPLSETVHELRWKGILDGVITCGQSFGGDLEAVNIYSGLIAGREILHGDALLVGMGPGNVGTGTAWGFSGIHLGEVINAVNILGGRPVFCPRISFADSRSRHLGISHHSRTVLGKVALTPSIVVLPFLDESKKAVIVRQIQEMALEEKHLLVWEDGSPGLEKLQDQGYQVFTMGRDLEEDRDYFLTAAAAGIHTGKISMQVGLN